MSGIPDDLHDTVRQRARERDPQSVARSLELEEASERDKYSCPFCTSSDALHVNPAGNYQNGEGKPAAHCFSCGETCSDTIAMAEAIGGLEHIEALEWLTGRVLQDDDASSTDPDPPKPPPPNPPSDDDGCDDTPPNEDIERRARRTRKTLEYAWQRISRDVVAPLAYPKQRGIPEALAREAGVRPLPGNYWRQLLEDIGPERAVEAGIWNVERSCVHPHSSSIMFPYWHRTESGDVEFDTLRFREPKPGALVLSLCSNSSAIPAGIAPTSPRSPYLAPDAIPRAREAGKPLYVVEGEIDALSLWRTGRFAIGVPGVQAWHDGWTKQLRGLEHVIVLGDRDDSGAGEGFVQDVRRSVQTTFGTRWKRTRFTGRIFSSPDHDDSNAFLTSFGWQHLDAMLEDLEASLESNTKAAV